MSKGPNPGRFVLLSVATVFLLLGAAFFGTVTTETKKPDRPRAPGGDNVLPGISGEGDSEGRGREGSEESASKESENGRSGGGPTVLISEVAPSGGGTIEEDWLELLVLNGSGDISGLTLTTFDSQPDDEPLANTTVSVSRGDRIVVRYNDTMADETDEEGDLNGNGAIDLYLASSHLSAGDEQVALYASGDISEPLDAVCWSDGDISSHEADDARQLVEAGMWPSSNVEDMIPSTDIKRGVTIARKEGGGDSDTMDDWYLNPAPSPGKNNKYFNFTGNVSIVRAALKTSPKIFSFEIISGGGDVSCLTLSDLDGVPPFMAFEPVTLSEGDVFNLIYGEGEDETDGKGDLNGNGRRDLYVSGPSPAGTTDGIALLNGWDILDALAWYTLDKMGSGEPKDLDRLFRNGAWNGNSTGDMVNVTDMEEDEQLVRGPPRSDTNSKDDWIISGASGVIERKEFPLRTFDDVDSVTCGVAPDSIFRMVAGMIDNATDYVHTEVYIFDNYKLAERLLAALERGVEVKVLLEGGPARGIPEMEKHIMSLITEKGGEVSYMIDREGLEGEERYTNIHAKYLIADGDSVFVTSENFRAEGVPYYGTWGNRGWGVVIESEEVAEYFEEVFEYDLAPNSTDTYLFSSAHAKYGDPGPDFDPTLKKYQPRRGGHEVAFGPRRFSGDMRVTPILCPDHTSELKAVLPLLEGAREYIYVQQHSVSDVWYDGEDYGDNRYMEAVYAAARRGVEVRLQFDETFKMSSDHSEIINETDRIAGEEHLNMMAKFTSNRFLGVEKVHNKGIIVDGEKVLISSVNWATNSIYNNREAGVIIEGEEVAEYYRDVFIHDWGEGIEAWGEVWGIVTDTDGKPLSGANVSITTEKGVRWALTDENGEFGIRDVPVGDHYLDVSTKGHLDGSIPVTVSRGERLEVNVSLIGEKEREKEGGTSMSIMVGIAVLALLLLVVLFAIIVTSRKTRKEDKRKKVVRISGEEKPFDPYLEKEESGGPGSPGGEEH